jgi:hypothetical protein
MTPAQDWRTSLALRPASAGLSLFDEKPGELAAAAARPEAGIGEAGAGNRGTAKFGGKFQHAVGRLMRDPQQRIDPRIAGRAPDQQTAGRRIPLAHLGERLARRAPRATSFGVRGDNVEVQDRQQTETV